MIEMKLFNWSLYNLEIDQNVKVLEEKYWFLNNIGRTTICMHINTITTSFCQFFVPLSYLEQVLYWLKQRWQNDNVIRIPVILSHPCHSLSFRDISCHLPFQSLQARRNYFIGMKIWPMFVWWINFYLSFSKPINNDQKSKKLSKKTCDLTHTGLIRQILFEKQKKIFLN